MPGGELGGADCVLHMNGRAAIVDARPGREAVAGHGFNQAGDIPLPPESINHRQD